MSRVYVDACVKAGIVRALRGLGVDVAYGLEMHASAPDDDVLAAAVSLGMPLLTEDTDFGELIFRDGLPAIGVILVRRDIVSEAQCAEVAGVVAAMLADARGLFVTINERGVRKRRLPPKS